MLILPAIPPGSRVHIVEVVGHAEATEARQIQAAAQLVAASREKASSHLTPPPAGVPLAADNHAVQSGAADDLSKNSRGVLGGASAGRPTAEPTYTTYTPSTAGRYDGTIKALSRPRNGGGPLIPGCPACGGAHWLPHNHEGGGVTVHEG